MSRVVVIVVTIVLALIVTTAPALAEVPYAVPTPAATGVGTQSSPFISGSTWDPRVTWEDDASGQWDLFSLFRAVPTLVPAGASAQRHPVAEGYKVVYEDDRAGNWDIFVYDTFPGDAYDPPPAVPETQLTNDAADQLDPDIDGGVVAYEDRSRGNWDIAIYDLNAGTSRFLTSNTADQVDPAIGDGKVVWADRRNGNWDIYCYDLVKKSLKRLTTNKAAQTRPHIGDDGVVVYQDKRNGDWDVYSYNLATGKERRLTSEGHNQTAPQIDRGRSVVYEDARTGIPHIWVCDLKTSLNRRVTDAPAAQTEPSLAEASVAWRDTQADAGDVHMTSLLYPSLDLGMDYDMTSNPTPYDSTVRFEGYLRLDYPSVEGLSVVVSGSGGTRKVAVAPTDVDATTGRYAVKLRHVVRNVTVRALFNDPGHLPDKAGPVTVKAYALLTRPSFTKLPRDTGPVYSFYRDCLVTGYLKPRHRAGSSAVKVQVYKYVTVVTPGETPHWELEKSVRAKVKDYGSYSSYRVIVRCGGMFASKWKVRAVHADGDHATTSSTFSAVREGM